MYSYYADEIIAKARMYDIQEEARHDAMVDEAKHSEYKFNLFGWGRKEISKKAKNSATSKSGANNRHWSDR